MVSITYSHRIICDYDFLVWLLKQPDKNLIYSQLLHIKSSSEQWKRCHNLILSSETDNNDYSKTLTPQNISAIFKIVGDPDFLSSYKDQDTKNIIFAIKMADERPFKCCFLTTPEKEALYRQNKHYMGISSVEIASGDQAKKIIRDFFSVFEYKREQERQ